MNIMAIFSFARTERIAISLGAIVLPLHDPVDVAEQIAVTDLICGGRLHPVLVAGYARHEFRLFGKSLSDRGRLMDYGLEIITRALAGERFQDGDREIFVRTLEVIRQANADVVALQEVQEYNDADISFLHGLENLDHAHVIYRDTFRKHAGPCGNVLMSRFPVRIEEGLDISIESVEPRGAIRVLLATPVGEAR